MKKEDKIKKKSLRLKNENFDRVKVLKKELKEKINETRKEITNLRVELENKKSKELIQKVRNKLISS